MQYAGIADATAGLRSIAAASSALIRLRFWPGCSMGTCSGYACASSWGGHPLRGKASSSQKGTAPLTGITVLGVALNLLRSLPVPV